MGRMVKGIFEGRKTLRLLRVFQPLEMGWTLLNECSAYTGISSRFTLD